MTLLEYVFTLLDPAEAERYRRFESEGLKLEQQHGPGQFRGEALKRLASIVLAQLRSGELVARGYAELAPLDEPPAIITKEWWDGSWTLNFFESSAAENGKREMSKLLRSLRAKSPNRTGYFPPRYAADSGRKITRIRVCLAQHLEATGGFKDGTVLQPTKSRRPRIARRLIIREASGYVLLDGHEIELTDLLFRLLLLLARAARTRSPYCSHHLIAVRLWGKKAPQTLRNVRDVIGDLRTELSIKSSNPQGIAKLIPRGSKLGWRLALSSSEIEIAN